MNSDGDDSDRDLESGVASSPADVKMPASDQQSRNDMPIKLKKAPDAPKRFKSAFIFFSTEKHKEIRSQLMAEGNTEKTVKIAQLVSEAWKSLSPEEKEKWDTMARKDKARYEVEKTMYTGPWKVPAVKRSLKDPNAPKRPMSAFLAYSNSRRAMVKKQNPHMGNAEISKHLSTMWKEAPADVRQKYIDQEFTKRQVYKTTMADWRKKSSEGKRIERQLREDIAIRRVEAAEQSVSDSMRESVGRNYGTDLGEFAYAPANDHQVALPLRPPNPAFGSTAATYPFLSSGVGRFNPYLPSSSNTSSSEQQNAEEKSQYFGGLAGSSNQPLASLFTIGDPSYLLSHALRPTSSIRSQYESGVPGRNPYSSSNTQDYNFLPGALGSSSQFHHQRLAPSSFLHSHDRSSQHPITSYADGAYSPYGLRTPFAHPASASLTSHESGMLDAYTQLGNSFYPQGNFGSRLQTSMPGLYQPSLAEYSHTATASNLDRDDDTDAAAYDLTARLQRMASQQLRQNRFGGEGPYPPGWNSPGNM